MFQQVRRLVEDLHALGALERPVLVHHALVLVRVGQVGDVVSTGPALVSSLCPYLQGGLLGLGGVLLLTMLPASVLRSPAVLLAVLPMLGLLLQRRGVLLQHNAIHCTAEGALCPRGDGVDDRRWSGRMLLPAL